MNKQFYGIAALALVFATTACANEVASKTALRGRAAFEAADQVRVSLFNTEFYRQHLNDNNGSIQITVFGGMNTQRDNAAQYYMPDAHDQYTISSTYTPINVYNNVGFDVVGLMTSDVTGDTPATGYNSIGSITDAVPNPAQAVTGSYRPYGVWYSTAGLSADNDEATNHFNYPITTDPNLTTSTLRAWNFGIEVGGSAYQSSTDYAPTFQSTIAPTLKQSQVGAGFEWNQHLSDSDTGWFLNLSTAVQWVQNDWQWNEEVATEQSPNTANANNAYSENGFPSGDARPANLTEAFAQTAWNYGKVDGKQSITRLSDIEVRFGYEFACEDTHHVQGYVGAIFPTGNKMKGEYLAEPVVGNNGHFGVMWGGTTEVQFTSDSDWKVSSRWDYNWRFLFANKQVRSFDLKDSQWSRYMYVWPNYETFAAATEPVWADATTITTPGTLLAMTPGINVFTQEVKVSPRQQFRVNTALVFAGENFRGELGLNMMARQAEKVELSNAWAETVVLAGSDVEANKTGAVLSVDRSIFNDMPNNQRASSGGVDNTPAASATYAAPAGVTAYTAGIDFSEDDYNTVVITADRIDLNSAASPTALTGAPYLTLGYAWEGDKVPGFMSIGGSYEYSFENRFINSWQLWGKLGFSF